MKAAKIKKITSIFICLITCMVVSLSVFAAGIDMSVFEKSKTFDVEIDSIDGTGLIDVANYRDFLVETGSFGEDLCFYPTLTRISDGELYFRLAAEYTAEDWAFFDTLTLRINNTVYTFTDVDNTRRVMSGGSIYETMVAVLDNDTIKCIEAIKQHRYEPIKARLEGSNRTIDFVIPQNIKDAIVELYDLYCEAGGLNQLLLFDGNTMLVNELAQTIEEKENLYISVYDYNYYKNNNPDLASIYGNDREAYLNHFITVGMSEGRQGNQLFNLATYKANNPDLVAAFGNDNAKYYQHFMEQGRAEGRVAA